MPKSYQDIGEVTQLVTARSYQSAETIVQDGTVTDFSTQVDEHKGVARGVARGTNRGMTL